MSRNCTVQETNRELARKINDEVRSNPHSSFAGKFIGIANGQVVAVVDNWDEVARLVQQAESDPRKAYCFEVGEDESAVEEIWVLR